MGKSKLRDGEIKDLSKGFINKKSPSGFDGDFLVVVPLTPLL